MGKFLKFRISNGETLTSGQGSRDILVPVDNIESVSDGVGAASVAIVFRDYGAALRTLTLTLGTTVISAPVTGASNLPVIVPPTPPTVEGNMPSQAVNRALTANPGGVSSLCQLGHDAAGLRGTDNQMYFVQAAIA